MLRVDAEPRFLPCHEMAGFGWSRSIKSVRLKAGKERKVAKTVNDRREERIRRRK